MPPAFSINSGTLAAADQIVEQLGTGNLLERIQRDECGDRAPVDEVAFFVDDKHPVGVSIECDADVAPVFANRRLEVGHVLGFDRAGRVVRKISVEFEIEGYHRARQLFEDVRNGFARHAVTCIDGDLERLDLRAIDEREAMIGELVENIAMRNRTAAPPPSAEARRPRADRVSRRGRYRAKSLAPPSA